MATKLRNGPKRGYYWRKVVCDGCDRACRYRDFRAGIPSFQEVHAVLRADHERGDFSRYRYKRRGTVLGIMHEHKVKSWDEYTKMCQQTLEEKVENL